MALNAAIVWEVRTTGNANNGGGFKTGASGTDYSQQDAAQYNLTTATTAAANAIILDASAAAVMVGNVLQVISGTNFTAGFYEITSVSVGVSITVDRNCTTGAGALGVINIGGCLTSPNTVAGKVVQGNTVYIKAGTYSETLTCITGADNGTVTWVGYNSTRTDNPTGTNRPLIDGGSSRTNGIVSYSGNIFKNIRVANCTESGITLVSNNIFINVKSSNNTIHGFLGVYNQSRVSYFNCEANNNGSNGFYNDANLINCYTHDNGGKGITGSYSSSIIIGSISDSNSNAGFDGYTVCTSSIAYNNTGGSSDGFNSFNYGSFAYSIFNNVSINNGRYGFNIDSNTPNFNYNCYNGNGTAGLHLITAGPNDLTSAPSFTDAANGDFSLAAGSPCIDAGFPAHSMAGATV